MILLDTHIWIWWVQGDSRLSPKHAELLQQCEHTGLGVSIISCWEVAKLVEVGRLTLPRDVLDWLRIALSYPGVALIPLTPEIVVESTRLPSPFHRDPADQLIVATARVNDWAIVTVDERLRNYPFVRLAAP